MSQTVEYTIDLAEPLTPSQLSAFKGKFKDLEDAQDIQSDSFISGTSQFPAGYSGKKFADELTEFLRDNGASQGLLTVTYIEQPPYDTYDLNSPPPAGS